MASVQHVGRRRGRWRPIFSGRILTAAAAAAAIAAVAFGSAPAASAKVPRRFAGVHFAFYPVASPQTATQMASVGVGSVLLSVFWPVIEAQPGTYDFSATDQTIGNLAAAGVQTEPILYGTPRWALQGSKFASDPNANNVPPTKTATGRTGWVAFVRQAVSRYGPGGTYWKTEFHLQHPGARPLPVRTWQVWNEPNVPTYYWPKADPKSYAKLLRISYGTIHAFDRHAKVAVGGLVCVVKYTCNRYLTNLYRQPKVKRYFNLVGLHPYGHSLHLVIAGVKKTRRVMKHAHDGRTNLWVSEIGWGSAAGGAPLNKGSTAQARLLKRAFRQLERNRRRWRISQVDWFDWQDPPQQVGPCVWCASAGLLDAGGGQKPAYTAFKHVS